jgi:hypothetical protein
MQRALLHGMRSSAQRLATDGNRFRAVLTVPWVAEGAHAASARLVSGLGGWSSAEEVRACAGGAYSLGCSGLGGRWSRA